MLVYSVISNLFYLCFVNYQMNFVMVLDRKCLTLKLWKHHPTILGHKYITAYLHIYKYAIFCIYQTDYFFSLSKLIKNKKNKNKVQHWLFISFTYYKFFFIYIFISNGFHWLCLSTFPFETKVNINSSKVDKILILIVS